jgi:hypothetical protein
MKLERGDYITAKIAVLYLGLHERAALCVNFAYLPLDGEVNRGYAWACGNSLTFCRFCLLYGKVALFSVIPARFKEAYAGIHDDTCNFAVLLGETKFFPQVLNDELRKLSFLAIVSGITLCCDARLWTVLCEKRDVRLYEATNEIVSRLWNLLGELASHGLVAFRISGNAGDEQVVNVLSA